MEHKWTLNNVRSTFTEYFVNLNHNLVSSSSVIPSEDDKSLLFVNSGMNQFKPIFLNKPHTFGNISKATNIQPCIRAGGKHNDIKDIGDKYHHTFFEMAGSWSFGDYWKKESIKYAWYLLINIYGLDESKIHVTYFEGFEGLDLKKDSETKKIWENYLPSEKIIPLGMDDNFWSMGYTGLCGPCTEIYYNKIEIWNIVFMQYDRISDVEIIDLPKRHIDTGMGLERLTSILQNVDSNYDIDAFVPIFAELNKLSKTHSYMGSDDNIDTSYRIICDHIRMITISISYGVIPDARKNGSVLRNICRRAITNGLLNLNMLTVAKTSKDLNITNIFECPGCTNVFKTEKSLDKHLKKYCDYIYAYDDFLYKLVPVVCETLKYGYQKLSDEKVMENIIITVKKEEELFRNVLKKGAYEFGKLYKKKNDISKEDIFKMSDEYGFPPEFCIFETNENKKLKIDTLV